MKRWHFHYPRLTIVLLSFVLAYILFSFYDSVPFSEVLKSTGYFGIFVTGIFFSYGFTAGPATALLFVLSEGKSIFVAGLIGGVGALIADSVIFFLIRNSFRKEVDELYREPPIKFLSSHIPLFLKKFLIPAIAGLIIASPLPDELGVSLLAFSRSTPWWTFILISYVLNSTGIIAIATLSNFS